MVYTVLYSLYSLKISKTFLEKNNKLNKMIHSYKQCVKLVSRRSLHNAYIIQPLTGALEQEKQASFLTKTIVRDRAPENIGVVQQENPEECKDMISSLRNSIIETMFFHRDEPLRYPKRMRERTRAIKLAQYKSKMSSKVLMNMLNVIWSNALARYVHCNCCISNSSTEIYLHKVLFIYNIMYIYKMYKIENDFQPN